MSDIIITDQEIRIKIPKKWRPGRGRYAYLLYLLEEGATWDSVSARLGMVDNRAWESAKRWAQKEKMPWPPRRKS